jgi:uncharacterized OsmC-like protein
MEQESTTATVHFAGNDLWVGISPSGHAQALDTNHERGSAATPVELLLIALGSCTAVDVISIMRKKRERVTDYRVEVKGFRRREHPRKFTRMEVRAAHLGASTGPGHRAFRDEILQRRGDASTGRRDSIELRDHRRRGRRATRLTDFDAPDRFRLWATKAAARMHALLKNSPSKREAERLWQTKKERRALIRVVIAQSRRTRTIAARAARARAI